MRSLRANDLWFILMLHYGCLFHYAWPDGGSHFSVVFGLSGGKRQRWWTASYWTGIINMAGQTHNGTVKWFLSLRIIFKCWRRGESSYFFFDLARLYIFGLNRWKPPCWTAEYEEILGMCAGQKTMIRGEEAVWKIDTRYFWAVCRNACWLNFGRIGIRLWNRSGCTIKLV